MKTMLIASACVLASLLGGSVDSQPAPPDLQEAGSAIEFPTSREALFRNYIEASPQQVLARHGHPSELSVTAAGVLTWQYHLPKRTVMLSFMDAKLIDAAILKAQPRDPEDALVSALLQEHFLLAPHQVMARHGVPKEVLVTAAGSIIWSYDDPGGKHLELVFHGGAVVSVRP